MNLAQAQSAFLSHVLILTTCLFFFVIATNNTHFRVEVPTLPTQLEREFLIKYHFQFQTSVSQSSSCNLFVHSYCQFFVVTKNIVCNFFFSSNSYFFLNSLSEI
uniref:Uncharacterized protein n=1 Tax=Cacopsylla melanoneura TaxID=428564 RepID=A0A8D8RWW7_9HEMI